VPTPPPCRPCPRPRASPATRCWGSWVAAAWASSTRRVIPRLSRLVALKVAKAGAHAGEEELARFRAEAEAVARLQHPNVVQVYEVGESNGLPYFALEFVEGGSLASRLDGTP
jgi:serine/threonine protein kinase